MSRTSRLIASAVAVLGSIGLTLAGASAAGAQGYPGAVEEPVVVTTFEGQTTTGADPADSIGTIFSPLGPDGVECTLLKGYVGTCSQDGTPLLYQYSGVAGLLIVHPDDQRGRAAMKLAEGLDYLYPRNFYSEGLDGSYRQTWRSSVGSVPMPALAALADATLASSNTWQALSSGS